MALENSHTWLWERALIVASCHKEQRAHWLLIIALFHGRGCAFCIFANDPLKFAFRIKGSETNDYLQNAVAIQPHIRDGRPTDLFEAISMMM